ncbi:MAG: MFS transporter [Verrucomicrobiaceae bacterium]|nr:MFS transporter [Verrucomicrobiaceae bacterium]
MKSFFQSIRELPRPFWVLVGAVFVNRFGVFVWPFLTLFITRQGNSPSEASWAVASYSLGTFAAAWLGGWLADRFGRNRVMSFAAFGSAVCMLAMSQASHWQTLALIAFCTGLIADCGTPASAALVQDMVPPGQRVAAFAVQRFAGNLGWSLGPMGAGFLAEVSYTWLFVVDAVTSVFFGVVAWFWLPKGRRTEAHLAGWGTAWASIKQNTPFLMLFLACLCGSWSFRQLTTTLMLHLEKSGHSPTWSGAILALNGVMIITMELMLAAGTRHFRAANMLAIGYLLMGGSYLVLLGSCPLWAFVVCMVVFTIGEMCAFSRQQAYAASMAPDSMRGRYTGFLTFAWALGGVFSSATGLNLYAVNPHWVWISSAVCGAVAASFLLASKRTTTE